MAAKITRRQREILAALAAGKELRQRWRRNPDVEVAFVEGIGATLYARTVAPLILAGLIARKATEGRGTMAWQLYAITDAGRAALNLESEARAE